VGAPTTSSTPAKAKEMTHQQQECQQQLWHHLQQEGVPIGDGSIMREACRNAGTLSAGSTASVSAPTTAGKHQIDIQITAKIITHINEVYTMKRQNPLYAN
jgi:hypothetical protein